MDLGEAGNEDETGALKARCHDEDVSRGVGTKKQLASCSGEGVGFSLVKGGSLSNSAVGPDRGKGVEKTIGNVESLSEVASKMHYRPHA